jgi:hypothetical protein
MDQDIPEETSKKLQTLLKKLFRKLMQLLKDGTQKDVEVPA